MKRFKQGAKMGNFLIVNNPETPAAGFLRENRPETVDFFSIFAAV